MDNRLRRWRRVATTTSSSRNRSYCKAGDRIRRARGPRDSHRDSNKHDGHRRQLERQRRTGRERDAGNDHVWRRVHRSRGPAIAADGANHGHEPCRFDKIRHRYISDYERHHAELDAEYPERGTRCDTNISNNGSEQRASGHLHTMEPLGSGVHQRVRHSGHKRELHGAAESSFACERDADSAKRGRSFETDFCRGVHHQQFFVATLCAIQRAGRSDATIVATLTPVPGSNPSPALSWALSGPGCSGSSCGTLIVVTTQSTSGNSVADSAKYTAPGTAPSPNTVTLTVTSQADPSKKAQATMAIQPGVSVNVSPSTATLAANHRLTLSAQVNGTTNTGMIWSVNGIAGGNTTFGQICAVASNPCQIVTSTTSPLVEFLAPGSIPSPNPVSATAVSATDSTKSASAQITVINHVLVSVQPGSVTLAPLAVQSFAASVLGTTNQNVVWQVQGAACSASGLCGTINPAGTYTAPSAAPVPDAIQVVAISSDDTSQSGIANVTISTGANILALHPSSVYAGAAQGFTLRVDGSGFVASSPGPGSAMLIGGTARITTCTSALECTAPVTAADVAVAGSLSIQMQNPSGTKSNVVALIVAATNLSDDVIALSSNTPSATGKDIIVVDPTTAGVSAPGNDVDLNVAALGQFIMASNACTLGGSAIPLQRPASGTSTADVCLFSQSGLDTSMTYTVSGPGDVAVIAKQPPGLGIIHLTLQIPASASPGARTLFIQNTNLDKTAASGVLEVN